MPTTVAAAPHPPAMRPRVRARRGQATDPHSIAERVSLIFNVYKGTNIATNHGNLTTYFGATTCILGFNLFLRSFFFPCQVSIDFHLSGAVTERKNSRKNQGIAGIGS